MAEVRVNNTYHEIAEYAGYARDDAFEGHYRIAQVIATSVKMNHPNQTTEAISEMALDILGDDAPELEVLAVSALAATIRSRILRRPYAVARREKREIALGMVGILPLTSFKESRILASERKMLKKGMAACEQAELTFFEIAFTEPPLTYDAHDRIAL